MVRIVAPKSRLISRDARQPASAWQFFLSTLSVCSRAKNSTVPLGRSNWVNPPKRRMSQSRLEQDCQNWDWEAHDSILGGRRHGRHWQYGKGSSESLAPRVSGVSQNRCNST